MLTHLVSDASPVWAATLARLPHDFYHLPQYVALCARESTNGKAVAFVAEENDSVFFVPLIVRSIDPPLADERKCLYDAVSPYGYPGPLLRLGSEGGDVAFLNRALAAFVDALREAGIVSVFVRLHPLFDLPLESLARVGAVVPHGDTVAIDLTLSREELWHQTRHNHRRDINAAKRAGHLVRIDRDWGELDTFIDLYFQTMRRLNAQEHYYFSRDHFLHLRQALGDSLHLVLVEIDTIAATAGLFTEFGGIVQYHLSGTADRFLANHPTKTMLDNVRDWAASRGNWVFHLGGGLGGTRDSLHHFKAGFSGTDRPFHTWRIVVDRSSYLELTRRWQVRQGLHEHGEPAGDFFPAYRKPNLGSITIADSDRQHAI